MLHNNSIILRLTVARFSSPIILVGIKFNIKIKLVESFGYVGYAHRELDLESIVFDLAPGKNNLFLLNVFPIRSDEEAQSINSKYCSRAVYIGLSISYLM
jgi:hypothetical protein